MPSILPTPAYQTPYWTVSPPDTWFIPTYVPSTVTRTMVSHCLNIIPSTKVPETTFQTPIITWTPKTSFHLPISSTWVSVPKTIYIPPTVRSPIIVPISVVSTVPSTKIITIP